MLNPQGKIIGLVEYFGRYETTYTRGVMVVIGNYLEALNFGGPLCEPAHINDGPPSACLLARGRLMVVEDYSNGDLIIKSFFNGISTQPLYRVCPLGSGNSRFSTS